MDTTFKRIQQIVYVTLLLFSLINSAQAVNFQWVGVNGGGDGTTWSDGNNWSNVTAGTVGAAPGTTDIAVLGDFAPDAAQIINLDVSDQIATLSMQASGNRAYTITNSANVLTLNESGGISASVERFSGTQKLSVDVDIAVMVNNGVVRNLNTSNQLVINGDIIDGATVTGYHFGGAGNPGTVVVNGALVGIAGNVRLHGGNEVIAGHPSALDADGFSGLELRNGTTLSLTTNTTINGLQLGAGSLSPTIRVNEAVTPLNADGEALRTLTIDVADGIVNNLPSTSTLLIGPPVGGSTGNVKIVATRGFGVRDYHVPVVFQANPGGAMPVLEFAIPDNAVGVDAFVGYDSAADVNAMVISGPGQLRKSGAGTVQIQTTNTYTGGTWIKQGVLQLGIDNVANPNGMTGQLPDTGTVRIDSGASLDLNSISDTLGGLAGSGTVRGGGATLTLNETLSPGNSPGTLTLTNISLSLASSSDYLVEVLNTGSFDNINLFGTITIQAGSELNVTNLPGFSVALGDSFTIVNNDGSDLVTGTFAGLAHGTEFTTGPGGMGYQILYNTGAGGNDIILIAVPEPSSVMLLGLGGFLFLRRRLA